MILARTDARATHGLARGDGPCRRIPCPGGRYFCSSKHRRARKRCGGSASDVPGRHLANMLEGGTTPLLPPARPRRARLNARGLSADAAGGVGPRHAGGPRRSGRGGRSVAPSRRLLRRTSAGSSVSIPYDAEIRTLPGGSRLIRREHTRGWPFFAILGWPSARRRVKSSPSQPGGERRAPRMRRIPPVGIRNNDRGRGNSMKQAKHAGAALLAGAVALVGGAAIAAEPSPSASWSRRPVRRRRSAGLWARRRRRVRLHRRPRRHRRQEGRARSPSTTATTRHAPSQTYKRWKEDAKPVAIQGWGTADTEALIDYVTKDGVVFMSGSSSGPPDRSHRP